MPVRNNVEISAGTAEMDKKFVRITIAAESDGRVSRQTKDSDAIAAVGRAIAQTHDGAPP
jgi:hypothetical protein